MFCNREEKIKDCPRGYTKRNHPKYKLALCGCISCDKKFDCEEGCVKKCEFYSECKLYSKEK